MKFLAPFLLIVIAASYFTGKHLERHRWQSKEIYALYDRDHHLEKCTRHYPLVYEGLRPGERIVAGNHSTVHRRPECEQ